MTMAVSNRVKRMRNGNLNILTLRVTPTSPYNIIMAMGPCGLVGMARKPHRPGSAGSRAPLARACAYKHGHAVRGGLRLPCRRAPCQCHRRSCSSRNGQAHAQRTAAPRKCRMQARLARISAGCGKRAWGHGGALGMLARCPPRCEKSHQPAFAVRDYATRTRGINLIDLSHFH